jgi:hypothetical protein
MGTTMRRTLDGANDGYPSNPTTALAAAWAPADAMA